MEYQMDLKVGNDNGNSEQDISINKEMIQQPNVNVEVDSLHTFEDQNPEVIIKDITNHITVTIDSPSCATGIYLIGTNALRSGEVLNNIQVGFEKKSYSDLPIVNTLGIIACCSVKKYYEENNQEIPQKLSVNVDMATSLPIGEYYENENHKSIFRGKFEDEAHYVTVHLGKKRVRVELKFNFVRVVPEATPVVFSLIEDSNGEVRSGFIFEEFAKEYEKKNITGKYFENKKILHLDIGDGTTEVPITDGVSPIPQFTQGYHYGAGHAIENGLERYANLVNLPSVQRQELSNILRQPNHKYYNRAIKAITPHLKVQVREILRKVKQQITKANNEVDILVVYGGGSILMKNILKPELKLLCDEREIELLYIPAKYAVTLNAEGLSVFVHGPIFEFLKNKELAAKQLS